MDGFMVLSPVVLTAIPVAILITLATRWGLGVPQGRRTIAVFLAGIAIVWWLMPGTIAPVMMLWLTAMPFAWFGSLSRTGPRAQSA